MRNGDPCDDSTNASSYFVGHPQSCAIIPPRTVICTVEGIGQNQIGFRKGETQGTGAVHLK